MEESIDLQIIRVLNEMVANGEAEVMNKNGENHYKLAKEKNMNTRKQAALKAWNTRRKNARKVKSKGFDEDIKFKSKDKKSEFDQLIAARVNSNKPRVTKLVSVNPHNIKITGMDFHGSFRSALKKQFGEALSKIVKPFTRVRDTYMANSLEAEISRALYEFAVDFKLKERNNKKSLHKAGFAE